MSVHHNDLIRGSHREKVALCRNTLGQAIEVPPVELDRQEAKAVALRLAGPDAQF